MLSHMLSSVLQAIRRAPAAGVMLLETATQVELITCDLVMTLIICVAMNNLTGQT